MSSRDYLIASDERVRLRCDIVFARRRVAEPISPLAMNELVCSVISFSEVIQPFPDKRGDESTQTIIIE